MGRQSIGQSKKSTVNMDDFPNVISFLHRLMLIDPPMCTLNELQNGVYSIEDVYLMNELLDLKAALAVKSGK